MARESKRFDAYHKGRMIYEKYLMDNKELLIENNGPSFVSRKKAKESIELENAEKLFLESIQGAEEEKDYFDMAIAYQQLGQMYYYQGRLAEAIHSLKKSLDVILGLISLHKDYKTVLSDIHYFMGLAYIDLSDFENAEKEIYESNEINKINNNKYNLQYDELAIKRLRERRTSIVS